MLYIEILQIRPLSGLVKRVVFIAVMRQTFNEIT